MDKSKLKTLAKLAKSRLKGNFSTIAENSSNLHISEDEQKIYERIFTVLRNKKDTPTPFKEVIDYSKFNKLSALGKELYIFDIIEKFNTCKTLIKQENHERQLA